ncbi:MAG: GumC family protein [Armatimonadota bacterium]
MNQRDITNYQYREMEQYGADVPFQEEPHGIDIHYYLSVFSRRWWIVVITVATVLGLGMLYTYTREPIYESSAKIVVVGTRSAVPTAENDIPILNDLQALTRNRSVDTQVEIMSSPDLLEQAFGRLSPSVQSKGFKSVAVPGWACLIAAKKDTDIISVTARAYTPYAAAELANTIADSYLERDVQQNNLATHQARKYVERRMAVAERQLADANADLSEFKRKTGFFAPDVQLTKAAEQIAQMSMDLDSAQAEVASGRRETQALHSQLNGESKDVVTNTTISRNPHFDFILDKINSLNSERAAMLQEFTANSREVRSIDNRINEEQQKLKHLTENIVASQMRARNPVRDTILPQYASNVASIAAASARVAALERVLSQRQQSAQSLPEREREFSERVQRVTLLQRTYEMLCSKYHTLLLSEQATLPNGMLVSRARIPGGAAYPNPRRNATMYFLLGVLLSIIVVIIADWLDNRVHEQTLIEQVSGLPTLSQVPQTADPAQRMLCESEHNGAMLESFRILRNNISFSSIDHKIRILAITSANRGDGKTTTSINLAVAMAMGGKRVLLVEGDFRRPSLHEHLKAPRGIGFTTVLTGASALENAIVKTKIENLSFLSSGPLPPNPAEILNSQQSRELFRTLAEAYDMVIVDCPPCVGLSDVQVISTIVDGMLLVVSLNRTLRPHLQMTIRTLSQIKAPLIGLVINRIEMRRRGYGYYYYGDYYRDRKGDDLACVEPGSGSDK